MADAQHRAARQHHREDRAGDRRPPAAFFEHGDIGLQPLQAGRHRADVGIHESTVSRVVNSKYLQCPPGLIPMRNFFTSHVETSAGDACSATAVKAMIRQLVESEAAGEPLSDHRLAKMLAAARHPDRTQDRDQVPRCARHRSGGNAPPCRPRVGGDRTSIGPTQAQWSRSRPGRSTVGHECSVAVGGGRPRPGHGLSR